MGNPMLGVKQSGQCGHVAIRCGQNATKPLPPPLQKHYPSGCCIDMALLNYHQWGACCFATQYHDVSFMLFRRW